MVIAKNILLDACATYFKLKKFKKKNNTWLKFSSNTISCVNIQTSQWDSNDYYFNIGIVINGIDEKPKTALGSWHVSARISLNDKTIEDIFEEVDLWFEKHSDMNFLCGLAKMDYHARLPVLMTLQAIDFFSGKQS